MPNPNKLPDNVPLEAFRFAADVTIGAAPEGGKTVPVTIMARSAQPIDHWFWGRIVHDMSGMLPPKPKFPLDYEHYDVLGFGDQAIVDATAGLTVHGLLTPFTADDRASEVIYKSSLGVPYEGSINWSGDGCKIEVLGENQVTEVNGYTFEGPGVVVRTWPMRGVAICPYGADAQTGVLFSAADKPGRTVPVTYFSQEPTMADETKPTDAKATATNPSDAPKTEETKPAEPAAEVKPVEGAPATAPAATAPAATAPAATAPESATQLSAGQTFMKAFGQQGAAWYVEGKTFEEASTLFAQQTAENVKLLQSENTTLKAQVAQLRKFAGEKDPLAFQAEEDKESAEELKRFTQKGASANVAKLAAGMKLPK